MDLTRTILGIDVSKDTLDIVQLLGDQHHYYQISNSSTSISKWIEQQLSQKVLVVLEPTGSYSHKVLFHLCEHNIPLSLVNPSKSHGFVQALGIVSKDDHQAAYSLALMGQRLSLKLYQPPSDAMQRRKQLLSAIQALTKQRQMLRNQIHALEQQIIFAPKALDALKQTLDAVTQQLQSLEEELNELSDEEHQEQFELIQSVVGIGSKTAQLILSATGGMQNFQYARQLSKFIGLVPWSHSSGSSVRKQGSITKKGCSALRASLYMCARSAKRHNAACKDLYERMRKAGKPHKKAMVAIMNKLIKQAFGVVKAGVAFDNQHYLKFVKN